MTVSLLPAFVRSAVGCAACVLALTLAPQSANAEIVNNGLTGNVEYDGWVDLRAGTPGLSTATLISGFTANEAGSGSGVLTRLSGFHYPAGSSLYSFSGHSQFQVAQSAVSDISNVVFTIRSWANPDYVTGTVGSGAILNGPTLNYNGGSQALTWDYAGTLALGSESGGGFEVNGEAFTFQWDLSSVTENISSFNVQWDQVVHAGLVGAQLESSDVFTVSSAVTAVPEPGSMAMLALGAGFWARRKYAARKNTATPQPAI